MAIAIAELDAISGEGYDGTLRQIVYEDSALFVKLRGENRVKVRGGRDIRWDVRYKKLGRADARNPDAQVSYEQKDTRTGALLEWKYYEGDTMITWRQRVENASGKFQIVSLVEDMTKELKEDMYDRFATDLFTANPNGNGFASLATIVDATDTYAGIAVADATNWASTETAETTLTLYSGTNPLAKQVSAATFGKKKPTIHITTRNLQNKFESLMQQYTRYEDVDMANAGFQNVTFKRAPVVGDDHCPASLWYGLDTSQLELVVSADDNFYVSGWKEMEMAGFPRNALKFMTVACNLKSYSRNSHFKYTVLNYAN